MIAQITQYSLVQNRKLSREPVRLDFQFVIRLGVSIVLSFLLAAPRAQSQTALANDYRLGVSSGSSFSSAGVTDIFTGKNSPGPYLLSYVNVDESALFIKRGNNILSPGVDYKVTVSNGSVIFTKALKQGEIARADYTLIPGRSKWNSSAVNQSLKFNLLDIGSSLSFDAFFNPSGNSVSGGGISATPSLLLGVNSAVKLSSQNTASAKLYFDVTGGNILSNSGMQLSELSKTSIGQVTLGFSRAGDKFSAPNSNGLVAGKQTLTAAANLLPIHGFLASATFSQVADLPATGKGVTTTSIGEKLTGSLNANTKLAFSRTGTTIQATDGTQTSRVLERLQIDNKVDKRTSITAIVDRSVSATANSETTNQTAGLTIRSQPTETVSVSGSFQNKLLPTGNEDVATARVDAAITNRLKLSALMGDRFTQAAAIRSREASVEYNTGRTLTLETHFQSTGNGQVETMATGFSGTAKPTKFLEVSGGIKLRDQITQGVQDPTTPDNYNMKIALGLPRNLLKLSGGWAENPDDGTGKVLRTHNRTLSMQSTLGRIDLSGGYTLQEEYLTLKSNQVVDLSFGWRLAKSTSLITSYKGCQSLDQNLLNTDTYAMTFTHKLGSIFDFSLSGAMTNYLKDGILQPNQDYRAEAKLGIKF